MSKIVYTDVLGASVTYPNYYDVDTLDVAAPSSAKAVYTDQLSGYTIVLKGSGLATDGDEIISGTVEKVTFFNDEGEALIKITQGHYKAAQLSDALQDDGFSGFMQKLFSGNDTIYGSTLDDDLWGGAGDNILFGGKGRDYISGGLGDDQLTGDNGHDIFLFGKDRGADVITDFDAKALGGQDHISVIGDDAYEIYASNGNTVIDFGDGDTLTLLGVKRSQITGADFLELG
jgi:hypothetical protein